MLGQFEAVDLANLAWAFAKMAFHDQPFLSTVSGYALVRVDELQAMGLTKVAWAFARLDV